MRVGLPLLIATVFLVAAADRVAAQAGSTNLKALRERDQEGIK